MEQTINEAIAEYMIKKKKEYTNKTAILYFLCVIIKYERAAGNTKTHISSATFVISLK